MKKIMAMLLVLTLSGVVLAGCGASDVKADDTTPPAVTDQNEATEGEMVKIGIGHSTSISKSKSLEGETAPVGQVDTVIVVAGFDKDSKVVSVTIDNAQTKVNFDTDLQVATDITEEGKTKVELGADYGMIKASSIGKEWFEQAAALEEWMVGKTIEEIKAMELNEGVTTDAELLTSVTVKVNDYIVAIEEAYNNAIEVEAGAVKLGLGTEISIAKSKGYSNVDGKETLPVAQVDTVMTVGAFDANGKVVGAIIDNAQTKINFDAEGKITTDIAGEFKTKNELKEEYGMIKASSIEKEWYEQAASLAKWMEGKTVEEIKAMETEDEVSTDADLTSSVTIKVTSYLATIEEAATNAK